MFKIYVSGHENPSYYVADDSNDYLAPFGSSKFNEGKYLTKSGHLTWREILVRWPNYSERCDNLYWNTAKEAREALDKFGDCR